MALIDLSTVFSTPETIYLRKLLKMSMSPRNLQKFLVPFIYEAVKDHGENALKSLNLVRETQHNFKG